MNIIVGVDHFRLESKIQDFFKEETHAWYYKHDGDWGDHRPREETNF